MKRFIDILATPYNNSDLKHCYEMGKDSVISGVNETNCNFRLFGTPEKRKAWERGVRDAKAKQDTERKQS